MKMRTMLVTLGQGEERRVMRKAEKQMKRKEKRSSLKPPSLRRWRAKPYRTPSIPLRRHTAVSSRCTL